MAKLINPTNLGLVDGVASSEKNMMPLVGTCSTSATTAAKVVECSAFAALETGASIRVIFTNGSNTTSGAVTLNVNGTGAKTVENPGLSTTPAYLWRAGDVVDFVYDGTNWVIVARLMRHGTAATQDAAGTVPGATSWAAETSGLYSSTVSLNGVTADDMVLVTPTLPINTPTVAKSMQDAWNLMLYSETVDGGIKFYVEEQPTVTVPFAWAVLPK